MGAEGAGDETYGFRSREIMTPRIPKIINKVTCEVFLKDEKARAIAIDQGAIMELPGLSTTPLK